MELVICHRYRIHIGLKAIYNGSLHTGILIQFHFIERVHELTNLTEVVTRGQILPNIEEEGHLTIQYMQYTILGNNIGLDQRSITKSVDITVFGDGSQTRSFQYCDDLIEAFRRYMELPVERIREFFKEKGLGAPAINTGNPGEYTIRELAEETLRQIPESKSKLIEKPLPSDDPKRRKPDITLAKELLGWEPKVPLQEGLARTIAYFRSR